MSKIQEIKFMRKGKCIDSNNSILFMKQIKGWAYKSTNIKSYLYRFIVRWEKPKFYFLQ